MDGLSMSLDEIISKKKTNNNMNRRRNNRRGGNNGIGRRSINKTSTSRSNNIRRKRDDGSKIIISNLEYKVTEKDLKDLFSEIGPIRSVSLNFDQNGRSKGSGQVVFVRRTDAARAVSKYHNVTLDGRSMKIEIVLSTDSSQRTARNSGRGGRNNNGRRGNRFNKKDKEQVKSAEELDAEMDAYMNTDE